MSLRGREMWPTRKELLEAFWEFSAFVLAAFVFGSLCGLGLAALFVMLTSGD